VWSSVGIKNKSPGEPIADDESQKDLSFKLEGFIGGDPIKPEVNFF
jgi:hypothetical protein